MLKLPESAVALTAFLAFTLTTACSSNRVLAQTGSTHQHQRSGRKSATASPKLTGTDGSQTGVAKFQGNSTVISAPPGQVLALLRQTNCSLLFLTGTYNNGSSFSYTSTGMTPNYERTLHSEAGLTTTADSVPAGCVDPTRGIGARPATYVGKTTSGVNVYAGVFYNFMTQAESLYVLTGTTSFNVSVLSFSRAGLLATADLNGDGNGDLIVVNGVSSTSAGSAQVYIMLGNADGTFGTAVPYTIPGANSLTAVVDDFNGDGKLDIVATSDNGQVSLLTGKGDGTFNTAQSFTPPAPVYPGSALTPSTSIFNLVSADLRGTSHKDLIASNGLVLLNDGTGNFTAAASAAFPPTTSFSNGGPYLATGDINRDGKLDLVVSGEGLTTYIGKGDGTFTPGAGYVTINTDGFITVTDLDGDGNPDIYVGDANNGLFRGDSGDTNIAYALMGNGDGTFSGAPMITGQYTGNNLGDVNGDGQPDLITNNISQYNQATLTFTVELGTSKGTFNPVSTITMPSTITITTGQSPNPVTLSLANASITSYAVGDLNGDGKADLAFLANYNGYLVYFISLSNGDGTFANPVGYGVPQIAPAGGYDNQATTGNLQIGDFNHDGKADLIFNFTDIAEPAQTYLQGLAVLPGNGDGTYGAPILNYTYNSATAPAANNNPPTVDLIADLNGDGNPDLIATNSTFAIVNGFGVTTVNLQAYTGKGDGTFNSPNTILTTNKLGPIVLADINHDGKLDVAALAEQVSTQNNTEQGQLFLALGKGDGSFSAPITQLLDGGDVVPESGLAAADFDGDGNIDLAYLDSESFSGIFYGKGDGTFTSVPLQDGAISPKDLVNLSVGSSLGTIALDLNKDGHPDILTGNAILLSLYGSAATTPPPSGLTATTTALIASASSIATGGSINFTATIAGAAGSTATPTGTVNFLDGTTSLSTVTLSSGAASYTTTALAAGSHSITAVYSGDSAFSTSTSSGLTITVTAPPPAATFSIALANATGTVAVGSNVTDTVTITPAGGFNQTVTLGCSGAPTNSTCILSPTSVTPTGTAAVTSTLTLTADTPVASLVPTRHEFEFAALLPFGLLSSAAIFTLGRRRKIGWSLQLLSLATLATLLAVAGCGGHHTTTTPPATTNTPTPGTYPLTVTATSGGATHTATYTVTIQ
ncbi:FG-GAP-like repeat-containing protein [Tunturiibacter lichenicola]|uniref:FG-GAP-like repeat-containing protein n=1 Tax=Tunturiibacter lichenicola TaxID=2051959 RepID=UPI0021B277A4|nr:FG-GAP-like repeat-containing protein [Edaphobacter lichenicola]